MKHTFLFQVVTGRKPANGAPRWRNATIYELLPDIGLERIATLRDQQPIDARYIRESEWAAQELPAEFNLFEIGD